MPVYKLFYHQSCNRFILEGLIAKLNDICANCTFWTHHKISMFFYPYRHRDDKGRQFGKWFTWIYAWCLNFEWISFPNLTWASIPWDNTTWLFGHKEYLKLLPTEEIMDNWFTTDCFIPKNVGFIWTLLSISAMHLLLVHADICNKCNPCDCVELLVRKEIVSPDARMSKDIFYHRLQ